MDSNQAVPGAADEADSTVPAEEARGSSSEDAAGGKPKGAGGGRRSKRSGGRKDGAGKPGASRAKRRDKESRESAENLEPGEDLESKEDLRSRIDKVGREAKEYLELAQRTQAEFENFRKRMSNQTAEADLRGQARVARELLPVVDNLERALSAAEPHYEDAASNPMAEGVRLVHSELVAILRRVGVESYEPVGERFDPAWHEALFVKEDDEAEPDTVIEVVEKGYTLDGEVLRPARVVVARGHSGKDRAKPSKSAGDTQSVVTDALESTGQEAAGSAGRDDTELE